MSTGTEVEVVMPQMGVSVSEGTVTRWLKQAGDAISLDEPLLDQLPVVFDRRFETVGLDLNQALFALPNRKPSGGEDGHETDEEEDRDKLDSDS